MLVEIRPDPSDEERGAIVAALERLLSEEKRLDEGGAEWWKAGLRGESEEAT